MDDLIDGANVEINNPLLPEHSKSGVVRCFDPESDFYYVVFSDGPPWRGYYERSELETNAKADRIEVRGSVEGSVETENPDGEK